MAEKRQEKTKMTKDIVPEGFSLGMAVVDAIPVIFFGLTAIRLASWVPGYLFLLGAILCFVAGLAKVLWKFIVVLKKKNIWFLFVQMRILMPIGFGVMVLALIIHHNALSLAAILAALIRFPSCIFFLLGIIGMTCMIIFAAKLDSSDAKSNWIEQITNGIAQACFFIGLMLL